MNTINIILERIKQFWKWLKENPKKVYKYSIIILVISLFFFVLEVLFYKPKNIIDTSIPMIFNESDNYIRNEKAKQEEMKIKLSEIKKELDFFKNKKVLVKSDSIRIEYLLNQYKKIQDEK